MLINFGIEVDFDYDNNHRAKIQNFESSRWWTNAVKNSFFSAITWQMS